MTSGPTEPMNLRDVLGLLRRKIRLIGLSVALVLGAALVYLLYATPQYSATAWLFVDTTQKNLLNSEEAYAAPNMSDNARIESEVLMLKSNTVAMATIDHAKLYAHPLYAPRLTTIDKARMMLGLADSAPESGDDLLSAILQKLNKTTSIRRMGQTYLISVSATSEDRQHAADLANALSQTYIKLQVQSKINAALAARDILQSQISVARDELAASEGAFDRYIQANLDRLSQESGNLDLVGLRGDLDVVSRAHLATATRLNAASSAFETQDWNSLAATLENSAVAELSRQRADLKRRIGEADDSSAIDLRRELEKLETDLTTQSQSALTTLRNESIGLEASLREKRQDLRTTVLQGDLSPTSLAQIYQLQQEADIAQRHYAKLLSRASDLQAQAYVQVADTRIVSEALPPSRASFPNKGLIVVVAVIVALVLGVGLAFLSEYYVGGVTTITQLANVLPVPVAAAIPRVELLPEQHTVADYVLDAPLSVYAESLRLMRSAIDQATAHASDCKVIMITSSVPAEGKSSVALGLARTYAAAGKSTLLIDADLRKPSLHQYLNVTPENSLLEYLGGSMPISDAVGFYTSDPRSKLGVIMGRDRADVPTDQMVQSDAFHKLLATAREAMEVIIIDTSPLLPVVDARYIAPVADVVIDCVRFGMTEQRDLRGAYAQLAGSVAPKTPILSLLTYDESKASGYRYDGYYGSN
ncbi:GumC family protein [Falsihalocynthiibacter sp. SS001]|uniref:GumC family protein n=1 Tax=Falsihalocynthiibacter sp. SS001 TaxID=3349698 RepID=UPI0036D2F139